MKKKVDVVVSHSNYLVQECATFEFIEVVKGNERNFHNLMDKYDIQNLDSFIWSFTKGVKVSTEEVEKMLNNFGLFPDKLTRKGGTFKFYKSFFYTHGKNAYTWVEELKAAIPLIHVFDFKTVMRPFKGGAPIEKQSHWYVEFTILNKKLF